MEFTVYHANRLTKLICFCAYCFVTLYVSFSDMFLLTASDTPLDFLPIAIQLIVAGGFVVTTMFLTHVIGPKLNSKKKEISFESGVKSVGDARQPFAIKYFLTAILFVLFDVEVIFLYPWAVNYKELGTTGLLSMGLFLLLFFAGFYYIIKKKALEWD